MKKIIKTIMILLLNLLPFIILTLFCSKGRGGALNIFVICFTPGLVVLNYFFTKSRASLVFYNLVLLVSTIIGISTTGNIKADFAIIDDYYYDLTSIAFRRLLIAVAGIFITVSSVVTYILWKDKTKKLT